jgi:hypothetical protein
MPSQGAHNNLSERALRQVVVGRANWQFCGSAEGGRTAAALYSVVGSCKHLGIDPFAYLRAVLPALFGLAQRPSEEELACWLPDDWRQRQRPEETASTVGTRAGQPT